MAEPPCPCGASICSHHNATWFYPRSKSTIKRNVRAVVFWWDVLSCWTWCPVIDGEPHDSGSAMGHYDTLSLAFDHADLWVRGQYGSGKVYGGRSHG